MMSQMEIYEMKAYCESRNRRQRSGRTFNIWNVLFLIAGVIMITLSACLLTYVSMVGVEMTGVMYICSGVVGVILGLGLIRISSWKI